VSNPDTKFEKHYRVSDIARILAIGRETVRKIVKDEPGVVRICMGRKEAHTIYSVPESVLQRILARLSHRVNG
jgi:hypothetical protein